VASKGILPYFDHYAANTIQKGLEGKYVCVVGGMSEWQHHAKYGSFCDESRLVQEPKSVNLVILIGGADISPSIYRHHEAPQTAVSPWADRRDEEAYTIARENNIPIVGICRGGQFLIAKAGGFLYQHTTGHGGGVHKVTTSDGKTFMVTSAHHQMFGVPLPEKAELLAWSAVSLSSEYIVGGEVDNDSKEFYEPEVEPECVWLPNINALAIQWHPEWMKHDSEAVEFHLSMIEKYMGNCIAERNKDELSVILSEDNKQ
jgi:GMP synthase-like glutamine amidotransferase